MNELRGMPVVKAMKEALSQTVETLKTANVTPNSLWCASVRAEMISRMNAVFSSGSRASVRQSK